MMMMLRTYLFQKVWWLATGKFLYLSKSSNCMYQLEFLCSQKRETTSVNAVYLLYILAGIFYAAKKGEKTSANDVYLFYILAGSFYAAKKRETTSANGVFVC